MHWGQVAVADLDLVWPRAVLPRRPTILENDVIGQDAGASDAVLMLEAKTTASHDRQEDQVLFFGLHERPWDDHEQGVGYALHERLVRPLIGPLAGVRLNPLLMAGLTKSKTCLELFGLLIRQPQFHSAAYRRLV